MTVASADRKAGPYNGNGATTSFSFTFKVFDESDVRVVFTSTAGVDSDLVLDTDYSVTLNGDQDASPGGSVTYPVSGDPLASGEKLTLLSQVPELQSTALQNQGGFYPKVIERALDKLTILVQQVSEKLSRAVKVPVGSGLDEVELPAPVAGQFLRWNLAGTGLEGVTIGDPAAVAVTVDTLANNLADYQDDDLGAGLIGFKRSPIARAVRDVGNFLSGHAISVWEFAHEITDKPDPADPETWDWKPAFDAAYAFIEAEYNFAGLRYGKSLYAPAGLYEISGMIGPEKSGIITRGDGALTTVIKARSGFTGDWLWKARNATSGANTGGCGMYDIGFDCNNLAGGIAWEDAYDCVSVDNVRVAKVKADKVGVQFGPRTGSGTGTNVSQTVYCKALFVYKDATVGVTAPPIAAYKLQESQFIGCKAWSGGYGGTTQVAQPPFYFEDCRSISMIGCSSSNSSDYGIQIYANTRSSQGVFIHDHLYENCTGFLQTGSSQSPVTTIFVGALNHTRARYQTPVSGSFDIDGAQLSVIDSSERTVTLGADSTQVQVYSQQISKVTDNGSDNVVISHPNATDGYFGIGGTSMRVVKAAIPRYMMGRPDTTDFAFIDWNSDNSNDFGVRVGVNRGSNTACITLDDTPAAGYTAATLLVNIGGVTYQKPVLVGSADSGGAGYRMLYIEN